MLGFDIDMLHETKLYFIVTASLFCSWKMWRHLFLPLVGASRGLVVLWNDRVFDVMLIYSASN